VLVASGAVGAQILGHGNRADLPDRVGDFPRRRQMPEGALLSRCDPYFCMIKSHFSTGRGAARRRSQSSDLLILVKSS